MPAREDSQLKQPFFAELLLLTSQTTQIMRTGNNNDYVNFKQFLRMIKNDKIILLSQSITTTGYDLF